MRTSLMRYAALLLATPVWLAAQSTTTPIQHVVVIFQENISFDHYFGTYPNAANNNPSEPVFKAAPNTPTVNGLSGPLLTANPNSTQPFRLTRAQAVTCDESHSYTNEQKAYNFGLMNLFVESVGASSASCDINGLGKKIVMGYYDGNTVTALWNYAQNFAMSDNSFSTVFGPSTPGALNVIAGTTHGLTVNSGSSSGIVSGGSMIGDARPPADLDDCTTTGNTKVTMQGKNIGDLLNVKKITWGWFQGGFAPSSRTANGTAVCASTHKTFAGATVTDYVPHHQPFQFYPSTANQHHMPPSKTSAIGQTDQANHQYDLSDFFAGLSAGVLPAVSYLKAAAYQDGHASNSNPLDEQTFLVTTVNAIMQSPFWSSTAIFILYDDSDGWYDHVMGPIVTTSAVPEDNLSGPGSCGGGTNPLYQGRCGYGPRQPLLAISPFAKVNYVDHSVSDQASIVRFIEDNWDLGRIGEGSMDAIAGSLLGMFNFTGTSAKTLILDPATGNPPPPTPPAASGPVTTAVANPKNASTSSIQMQLDGTASFSSDGKPLTWKWSVAANSPAATIGGADTPTPLVQFQGGAGLYTFTLTVTDSSGKTATDNVSVTYVFRSHG